MRFLVNEQFFRKWPRALHVEQKQHVVTFIILKLICCYRHDHILVIYLIQRFDFAKSYEFPMYQRTWHLLKRSWRTSSRLCIRHRKFLPNCEHIISNFKLCSLAREGLTYVLHCSTDSIDYSFFREFNITNAGGRFLRKRSRFFWSNWRGKGGMTIMSKGTGEWVVVNFLRGRRDCSDNRSIDYSSTSISIQLFGAALKAN